MYGLFYECKFLTIEETNKKNKKNYLLVFEMKIFKNIFLTEV